jgi:hypothetical protein
LKPLTKYSFSKLNSFDDVVFSTGKVAGLRKMILAGEVEQLGRKQSFVRFQVLTTASMKTTVFWDIAPCSLVEVCRRLRGGCCLHHQGDVHRQTTWRNIPEDSHLQTILSFLLL